MTGKKDKQDAPKVRGAGVIICNLPLQLQHADLRDLFAEFGVVVSCCMSWAIDQCIAIVQLQRQSDANKAVLELNGTEIRNQVINAALYPVTESWQAADLVFIQYLPALYSLSDVQQLLHGCGVVQQYWWISSDYIRNTQNALIRMETTEQASCVIAALDSVFFIGCSRNLTVKLINKFIREDYEFEISNLWDTIQEKETQREDKLSGAGWRINFEQSTEVMLRLKSGGKNTGQKQSTGKYPAYGVCVRNIPGKTTKIQQKFLRNNFRKFGNIARINVLRYPNGGSYGYGFVDFYDAASASKAMQLNGCMFESRTLKVSISNKTQCLNI